jgi:hypothetical protein
MSIDENIFEKALQLTRVSCDALPWWKNAGSATIMLY